MIIVPRLNILCNFQNQEQKKSFMIQEALFNTLQLKLNFLYCIFKQFGILLNDKKF